MEYRAAVAAALQKKMALLDKKELPKVKEELRAFHSGVSSVCSLLVKKGLISEDPYKNDEKVNDLSIPNTGAVPEANKRDELGRRLSSLDNQFDFLCNFFSFTAENLGQNTVKTILGLVNYIDWMHISPESKYPVTASLGGIIAEVKRLNQDPMLTQQLYNSIGLLEKTTPKIYSGLKILNDFNREMYKDNIRSLVVNDMKAADASSENIKRKLAQVSKGTPFYQELVEEIIKEDFANDENLRAKVFNALAVPEDKKTVQKTVNYKLILTEGLNALGGSAASFQDVYNKILDNNEVIQNQKRGLWVKIKNVLAQMVNKAPDPVMYSLEYVDPIKGSKTRENVNFTLFTDDLEKKIKILGAVAARGTAAAKLDRMDENQLIELLQRNIRDVQNFHKTLSALDEMFKSECQAEDRSKIKGIKPELSAIKNASTLANQRFHEYHDQKVEEAQFKKLGLSAES